MFQMHVCGSCSVQMTRHAKAMPGIDMVTSSHSGVCISNRHTQPGGSALTTCNYEGIWCLFGHVQIIYCANYAFAGRIRGTDGYPELLLLQELLSLQPRGLL